MSRHFKVLKEADLIQGEKACTITYRLNVSVLEEALLALLNRLRPHSRGSESHDE